MRLMMIFVFSAICLITGAQTTPTRNWVDIEVKYTDSVGRVIIVHNSLPKGGATYTDSAGNTYSYVIVWNRVINESEVPMR